MIVASGVPVSSGDTAVLLEARGIYKSFGGTRALADVDFVIRRGERVAVMGENGAGKSTLMKVFAGVHRPDRGSIVLGREAFRPRTPLDAIRAGVTTVYQEPSVFGHLSVLENLFAGRQMVGRLGFLSRSSMERAGVALLEELGIKTNLLSREMRDLSLGEQQQILIARAASRETRLLILDEPTSILTNAEADHLFSLIEHLAAAGTGVIYITHRFDELGRVADRFVVLRNGRNAGEALEPDRENILQMMGSAEPLDPAAATPKVRESTTVEGPDTVGKADDALVVLDVERLTARNSFSDISLRIRQGEIVGLYGLVGAGRTELALALFGELRVDSGKVRFLGREYSPRSGRQSIRDGIVYLPEDRKSQGIFQFMSVGHNIVSAVLDRLSNLGFVRRPVERKVVADAIEELSVKTEGPRASVMSLSGGNQQKVLLARLIATEPKLLILDEPTRGIDVGTKAEIHKNIRRLAKKGLGVLLISSELPELLELSDHVHVLHEGALKAQFARARATEKAVLAAAVGMGER